MTSRRIETQHGRTNPVDRINLAVTGAPVETPTGNVLGRKAEHLHAHDVKHLQRTAEIIRDGGIVAFPFNGIFGLFGDIDRVEAAELILEVKNRPHDRKLIQVPLPEFASELADFSRVKFEEERVVHMWKDVHALGLVLPASTTAPHHLIVREDGPESATVLPIWTEYDPLRYMLEHFRKLGGRALVGTSANKSGDSTHWKFDALKDDFKDSVHALIEADFTGLPEIRRRSTSIVDLTGDEPRLHREGNVTREEIAGAFEKHGLPPVHVGGVVIKVNPRA